MALYYDPPHFFVFGPPLAQFTFNTWNDTIRILLIRKKKKRKTANETDSLSQKKCTVLVAHPQRLQFQQESYKTAKSKSII